MAKTLPIHMSHDPLGVDIPTFAAPDEAEKAPVITISVDAKTIFLGGLFILAVLTACYITAGILMPIILACVMKLVLQPVMRALEKIRIPRILAALLIVLSLLGVLAGLGAAVSVPATNWAHQLPRVIPKLQNRLSALTKPLEATQDALHKAEDLTSTKPADPDTLTVAVQDASLSSRLFSGTKTFASALFETMLVLFFMLVSGDTFLRRLVEILPRFKDKKQAVAISQQIETDIAGYLAAITMMNGLVGFATALIIALCGAGDPILWGTIAFLLNYIPIVGPIINMLLLALAGLFTENNLGIALLPAGLYLLVHLIEGQLITPMLLARRFTLNPVLVILALVFWSWMWGVAGAILATPLLAIAKIIFDRIESLKALGHFMEG